MEKFTKVKNIGKGNMGACALARNNEDGRYYVIKQVDLAKLNKKERQQSLNEAKVLSALRHPNVINYFDSFLARKSDHLCIVMEYADGGDLSQRIKNNHGINFSETQVLDWLIQCVLSLHYVHQRKILHRDVKTQNIFLTQDNLCKLGDFGIARTLNSTYDQASTFVGTPYYLSPELILERPYDHMSDVWALGVVLYELMALRHPFNANDMKSLMHRILKVQYEPPPPMYSSELRAIVAKILVKDPMQRIRLGEVLELPIVQRRIRQWIDGGVLPSKYVTALLRSKLLPPSLLAYAMQTSASSQQQQTGGQSLTFDGPKGGPSAAVSSSPAPLQQQQQQQQLPSVHQQQYNAAPAPAPYTNDNQYHRASPPQSSQPQQHGAGGGYQPQQQYYHQQEDAPPYRPLPPPVQSQAAVYHPPAPVSRSPEKSVAPPVSKQVAPSMYRRDSDRGGGGAGADVEMLYGRKPSIQPISKEPADYRIYRAGGGGNGGYRPERGGDPPPAVSNLLRQGNLGLPPINSGAGAPLNSNNGYGGGGMYGGGGAGGGGGGGGYGGGGVYRAYQAQQEYVAPRSLAPVVVHGQGGIAPAPLRPSNMGAAYGGVAAAIHGHRGSNQSNQIQQHNNDIQAMLQRAALERAQRQKMFR